MYVPCDYTEEMLNKELIQRAINTETLEDLINIYESQNSALIFIFKSIGRIKRDFSFDIFEKYTTHPNRDVRFWAIKTIGKSKNEKYLHQLMRCLESEEETINIREIVSSIGRMRTPNAVTVLLKALSHEDPKVIMQAIRGLLYFKGDTIVDSALVQLNGHENETIRQVIEKEYFAKKEIRSSKQPHPVSYDYLKNTVVLGDVIDTLKFVKDESVHLTFTSPPYYNARDYSIYPSYEAYLLFLKKVFEQTYRITKEGRFLIVNTSPVIVPRISRAHSSKRYPIPFDLHSILIAMGWEFIDDIVWMKPEYSVKNRVGGFQQHRKPLGYKPNTVTEYVMVYRKKTDKLLDWNIHQYNKDKVNASKVNGDFETTNVWQISPKSDKVHSAVFPEELCERIVKYYSYVGDLLFDPFAGSGTFGRVAKKLDRYFFLTEKSEEYFEYMRSMKKSTCESTKFLTLKQFEEIVNDFNE